MHKKLSLASLFIFTSIALAAGLASLPAVAVSAPAGRPSATTPIQHVAIIYQENHTFDDTLGAVCQTRSTSCNGYIGPVTFADGQQAQNIVQPDIIPDVLHTPAAQALALSNQWDHIGGCTSTPYRCVSHVDPTRIPNLATLAD